MHGSSFRWLKLNLPAVDDHAETDDLDTNSKFNKMRNQSIQPPAAREDDALLRHDYSAQPGTAGVKLKIDTTTAPGREDEDHDGNVFLPSVAEQSKSSASPTSPRGVSAAAGVEVDAKRSARSWKGMVAAAQPSRFSWPLVLGVLLFSYTSCGPRTSPGPGWTKPTTETKKSTTSASWGSTCRICRH
ncbi:unnamed protein product [Amoebophrya sp. A120]|nr:unnamed protein product [Amoebophrya sp. A120]|eukprot:GSA120T00020817001.1